MPFIFALIGFINLSVSPSDVRAADVPFPISSFTAPHSPRRHQKLNLRMKSFSLDESGEHFHHGGMTVGAGNHSQGCGPPHGHHRLTHHRSSNPNAATTTSSSGTLNSNSAHNSQASFYCQCNSPNYLCIAASLRFALPSSHIKNKKMDYNKSNQLAAALRYSQTCSMYFIWIRKVGCFRVIVL